MQRAILCVVVLCFLVGSVAANDFRFDIDGGADGNGQRSLQEQLQGDRLTIRENPTASDQQTYLQLDFTTVGFPRLRLSRFRISNSTNATMTPEFTFRIGFRNLVEFIEMIPNNGTSNNGTAPNNGTSPNNGTQPNNGTLPNNGTIPTNGTEPINGTLPINGTEPINNGTEPINNGTLPTNGTEPNNGTAPNNGTSSNGTLAHTCFNYSVNILNDFSFLGASGWSPIVRTVFNLSTNSSDNSSSSYFYYQYCSSLNQPNGNAIFTLCIEVAPKQVSDAHGNDIGPSRIKLDLNLTGYNFVQSSSRLALIALVASSTAPTKGDAPNTIYFGSDGVFDWNQTLDIPLGLPVNSSSIRPLTAFTFNDTQGTGVNVTDDDPYQFSEVMDGVAFCFESTTQSDVYIWDPSMEIKDPTGNSNDKSSASAIMVTVVPVILAILSLFIRI